MRKMMVGFVVAVCAWPAFAMDDEVDKMVVGLQRLQGPMGAFPESPALSTSSAPSGGWLSRLTFWGWEKTSQEGGGEKEQEGDTKEWVVIYPLRPISKLPQDGNIPQNTIYAEESGKTLRLVVAIQPEKLDSSMRQGSSITEGDYELIRLVGSNDKIFNGLFVIKGKSITFNNLEDFEERNHVLNMLKKGGVIP